MVSWERNGTARQDGVFCVAHTDMPGCMIFFLLVEANHGHVESKTKIPVVSLLYYDSDKNSKAVQYSLEVHNPWCKRDQAVEPSRAPAEENGGIAFGWYNRNKKENETKEWLTWCT